MRDRARHAGLELVVGSMFSGKSEKLIRRAKRAVIAKRAVQVLKPVIDDRYGTEIVRSHDGDSFAATPVRSSAELPGRVAARTEIVAIDEVQFFDATNVTVVRDLVGSGRRVICAGLDLDFRGGALRPDPDAHGARRARRQARGDLRRMRRAGDARAAHRRRRARGVRRPIIVTGATEAYDAPCRNCHMVRRDA